MTSDINSPQWASVYKCQREECAFTSPVRTGCGLLVMCSVVCLCQLFSSAWMCCLEEVYIDVCYCDMFSVVNVYLEQLKFYHYALL